MATHRIPVNIGEAEILSRLSVVVCMVIRSRGHEKGVAVMKVGQLTATEAPPWMLGDALCLTLYGGYPERSSSHQASRKLLPWLGNPLE
jgi:hypothetical protein